MARTMTPRTLQSSRWAAVWLRNNQHAYILYKRIAPFLYTQGLSLHGDESYSPIEAETNPSQKKERPSKTESCSFCVLLLQKSFGRRLPLDIPPYLPRSSFTSGVR